jgi:hypothetical protein
MRPYSGKIASIEGGSPSPQVSSSPGAAALLVLRTNHTL